MYIFNTKTENNKTDKRNRELHKNSSTFFTHTERFCLTQPRGQG